MQIILLDKVVNVGGLGDIVKVKDGYARNFLIPTGLRPPRHRCQQGRIRSQARRTRKGCGRQAGRVASPRRKARRFDRQADAKGWRRRPPVRFGHQRRHRRRAGQARLQGCQGASASAQRPDQGRWRQHRERCAAHRRGGRHHRDGLRRNRLIPNSAPCAVEKAALGRLLFFRDRGFPGGCTGRSPFIHNLVHTRSAVRGLACRVAREVHVRRFLLSRR
jgi:hypothetical protein